MWTEFICQLFLPPIDINVNSLVLKIQAVTINEPATGRRVDLKMETLPRISSTY
jgi:hypothetical protein